MREYIINEGALNYDTLYVAEEGKVFKGGFKFAVKFFTFSNEWCDHVQLFYAKTLENALKRYKRETKRPVPDDFEYIEY